MRFVRPVGLLFLISTFSLILVRPAMAQVTPADIQRLQDDVYDASRDVSQLRSRDATLASQLQSELDDARDEAIYLKVKLRKNEPIARNDYTDVRDRIESIRSRARGDTAARSAPPAATGGSAQSTGNTPGTIAKDDPARAEARPVSTHAQDRDEIPVGTEFDVRLQNSLSSKTAQVEDRFEVTTMVDLRDGERVLVPAGSIMRGVVSGVNKAGRVDRKGSLTLAFDQITVRGRTYPMRATVTQVLESEGVKGEVGKIGAGAGVGAIIGGILGGAKGALAGILIGGGGVVAATEGNDVELQAGRELRVRLDSALNLR